MIIITISSKRNQSQLHFIFHSLSLSLTHLEVLLPPVLFGDVASPGSPLFIDRPGPHALLARRFHRHRARGTKHTPSQRRPPPPPRLGFFSVFSWFSVFFEEKSWRPTRRVRRGRARGERGGAKRRRRLAMEGEAATTTTITETVVTITETTREVSLGKVALVLILVLLLAYLATRHVLGIGNRRRITLLVGPAGSGKTTLFRQVSYGTSSTPRADRTLTLSPPPSALARALARSFARLQPQSSRTASPPRSR